MTEEWRPIPGYEGQYEASSLGRIRSFRLSPRGRILRPGSHIGGLTVALGRGNSQYVHALVALTFIGPRPLGLHIAHLDGNNRNNTSANLKYVTRSENEQHKVMHGSRRLSAEQVRELRAAKSGIKQLAAEFGISTSYAYCLRCKGNTEYKHDFVV